MDQGDTLDFKALRAKFQEEDHIMKQPTMKPALPEKPRVVPLAQSPTHFLPAGARPSLLSSISLEGRSGNAPRVIFKEDKKESKKPLIQINSKARDKSEGKSKKGKDKTKASKEKPDEGLTDQKQKNGKEKTLPLLPLLSGATKESTAELVPDVTAPQATVSKKKGFLGFKKSPKRNSAEVPAEPILDTLSLDGPGPASLIPAPLIPAPLIPAPLIPAPLTPAPLTPAPLIPAPLIPAPSDFGNVSAEPEYGVPKAHLPNIPTLPDAHATVEIFPASLDFIPPPAFIPDTPAPETPTPESETPLELEPPSLPVSRPASQNGIIPDPPSAAPTPPPGRASPMASAPSPSPPELDELAVEEAGIEAVNIAEVEAPPRPLPPPPPPAAADPPASIPPSPKAERPISALAALSRVEDLNPGKRTSPCDQRIFNALEKARRKISPPTNPSTSYSITPPPEELPSSLLELPPIDYEGNALLSKPVNGFDHSQASPVLEGITEEGPDPIPELLVVPPPLKKVLPDPESLGPTPEKPGRPHSVNLSQFIPPPPVRDNEVPAPPEFSETDTTDDLASEAYSHSEWGSGEHTGPDTPDGQNLPEFYSNGMTPPGAEVYAAPDRDNREPESSFQISPESPPPAGLEGDVGAGAYESPENAYETMPTSAAKKKGKSDGLKKRKGPPKNPYGEAQKETNEEKSKLGRFSKNDKKAAAAAATGAEGPDEKELKKREKQRLEKEKKELKEKQEREKKEQKEREKKENEMKKKFKITGQEDAMYQAKVTVTNKGRKNDLPVNSGDIVSIIRTTNCPKGKWLARDGSSNYGYIAVDHVELDIKEMLELGKKAAITRKSGGSSNNNNVVEEEEVTRTGSRASNHYPLSAESFTDDSEEWTGDDEEPLSPAPDPEYPTLPIGHNRTLSMPDMGNKDLSVNHVHSQSDISADGPNVQARQEALQKLATFFRSPKPEKPAAR
ncbi:FYN-binding protein 1-like [Cebidichthys violaceus]|uniref:FYN-binding protein 1-like n=1 Tax=Cebidichthys violaceus TaxID=271503 RepID=UPI0035CC797D